MKTNSWMVSALFLLTLPADAQIAEQNNIESPAPVVTERGPHHRTWARQSVRLLPNGRAVTNRSSFVELETGLHVQRDGQWLESSEQIELFEDGAIARQGPHQVIWAPNINTAGAIDVLTPDGNRLRSHVLGLGIYDPDTGRSEMIAEIKDSIGQLNPPNEIRYRDCFDGVRADLRYLYRKGSFVQDVVVLEQVSLPEGYDPATTRLEVWTEFLEAPAPVKREQTRGGMADESLDFGAMQIGPGKAFAAGEAETRSTAVAKRWVQIQGRTFLIEAVRFAAVKPELDRLPRPNEQAQVRPRGGAQAAVFKVGERPFPTRRQARGADNGRKIQMALLAPPTRGLVLDYDLSGSLTNYTFKCDTTYYISGSVNLRNPTFEGGTVVKFANTNSARLNIPDPSAGYTWLGSAYRPVILTARDDHSVGQAIGSSALSGYYAQYGLWIGAGNIKLEHLRVSHAIVGLYFDEAYNTNRHVQIIHCGNAMEFHWCHSTLENVLVYQATNLFAGEMDPGGYKVTGRHVTVNQLTNVSQLENIPVCFTNSLFVNVRNGWGDLTVSTNAVVMTSSNGVFQTVGAAAHYLATNSTYRNAGLTNVGTTLLSDLTRRTTYPPIVIGDGNWFTNSLALYPQAQRDTDAPDLGYHYDSLDYVFSGLALTNATITAMPGVAIGTRTLNSYGLALLGGASFFCEGTPANLNRIVRYNTVQEQANTNWTEYASGGGQIVTAWTSTGTAPHARLRFIELGVPAGTDLYHFLGYQEDAGTHDFRDSQFHGGVLYTQRATVGVTNSLFNRTRIILEEYYDMNPTFRNCTFAGSDLQLAQFGAGTWTFNNNLFDATTNSYVEGSFTHNYNAYTTNATRLTPNGANDKKLSVTNIAYQTGWLGRFYLPTNLTSHSTLLNSGSAAADTLGFFHYTAVTNQTRELTSTIDMGFHYVAVNSSGQPIDTDGDGLADYFEDSDGDGTADAGETDWQSYNSFNGLTGTPGLQVFTPLK